MNKIITGLVLVWLVVMTGFGCYVMKAEHEFLKFADFVLDDNLKNVVQSGGVTYYVVDMENVGTALLSTKVKLWQPMYVAAGDLDKLIDWKRTSTLMFRDFQNLDFQSRIAAAKADQYLKSRILGMQDRKMTPEEKAKQVKKEKRKHDSKS